ncbi:glycosyltransferase [Telluribacter humicola]|uniref:glycosyltransferase n=1 Tax=Telluribacter humicola TaxID=1720261 RepID=UPI001A960F5B|nr:glycosyltransferase [Telluribacter humicola]
MVQISKKTTIACLPVAGRKNPYQWLMMQGLNQNHALKAFNGIDDRFLGIIRTVVRDRPDYLHFDWIISYYYRRWRWLTALSVPLFFIQIIIARHLFRTRIVWTLHNVLPHDMKQVGLHSWCQRFMARQCDWIRVFSLDTVARAAQELQVPPDKLRVVPEGDYTSCYPNTTDRLQARQYLKLSASSNILLYLGLIKPYKGVLELIHHFKQLQLADTYLIIAGKVMDKAYGEAIRCTLDESVVLEDQFIPEDVLQYYYHAADAVVLPFKNIENSGSVIMAMGFAKPIIAPAIGVVKDRLSQQSELLFRSEEELPEKIYQVLQWPDEKRNAIGTRNYEALRNCRWEDLSLLFV